MKPFVLPEGWSISNSGRPACGLVVYFVLALRIGPFFRSDDIVGKSCRALSEDILSIRWLYGDKGNGPSASVAWKAEMNGGRIERQALHERPLQKNRRTATAQLQFTSSTSDSIACSPEKEKQLQFESS